MNPENEPIFAEAAETWLQNDLWIAVYNEPVMKGYVRLPDELVDAWGSTEEIGEALDLPFPLAYGPHPAVEGFPEPERRWIGVDAFEVQTHLVRTHGELPSGVVEERIHAQLMVLVARLITAAEFAKAGLSVKPAKPTYTHEDILKMAVATGHNASRAEVRLGLGESSWYPDMGYHSFKGPGDVDYQFTGNKVHARHLLP